MDIILRLQGARKFQSDAQQSAKAVKQVGDSTAAAGRQARAARGSLLNYAAAGAAIYAGVNFLRSSATETIALAKASAGLTRVTGMDTQQASAWVQMTKVRGIESKQLMVSFLRLNKSIYDASTGGKKTTETFKKLGVSQDAIRKGNTYEVLLQAADAFAKIKNPAERAALAQQLFGRQGYRLLPILQQGREGIRQNISKIVEMGGALDKHGSKKAIEAAKAQRDFKLALNSLKVVIATVFMPILASVATTIASVTGKMGFLRKHTKLVRTVILALVAAFVIWKVATLAVVVATKAAVLWNGRHLVAIVALKAVIIAIRIALLAWTVAQWALNAALYANPIVLIVAAVTALIAGFVILYLKVKWFRDLVAKIWPALVPLVMMLTGPIGAVAFAFVMLRNKASATSRWIIGAFNTVVNFFKGLPGKIWNAAKGMFNGVVSAFRSAINWIIKQWNNFKLEIGGGELDLGPAGSIDIPTVTLNTPDLPYLATGGVIQHRGSVVVGDAGPEIVTLPAGAEVRPLSSRPEAGGFLSALAQREQTIITKVYLDRRQIAEAVGGAVADARART